MEMLMAGCVAASFLARMIRLASSLSPVQRLSRLPVSESKLKNTFFRLQSQYFCFIDTYQLRCLRGFCLTSSERGGTGLSLNSVRVAVSPGGYYTFHYTLSRFSRSARWSCRCPPTT